MIKTNIMAVYSCDILCRERLTKYINMKLIMTL